MARKYYYYNDIVPSQKFEDDSFSENDIEEIGFTRWAHGVLRYVSANVIRVDMGGFGGGWPYATRYWCSLPGLYARFVDGQPSDPGSADMVEVFKIMAAGSDASWDTGDGGDVKFWLAGNPTLSASGDSIAIVRYDWEFLDEYDGTTVKPQGMETTSLFNYWDTDEYQSAGLTAEQSFQIDGDDTYITFSSTQAFIGTYSWRFEAASGYTPYATFLLNDGTNLSVYGIGENYEQHKAFYFSCWIYFDTGTRCEPRFTLYLEKEASGYTAIRIAQDKDTSTTKWSYKIGGASYAASGIDINDEQWIHLEWVAIDGTLSILVDGEEIISYEGAQLGAYGLEMMVTHHASIGTDANNYLYVDKSEYRVAPNKDVWFTTIPIVVTNRISRWESANVTYLSSELTKDTDYSFTLSILDEDGSDISALNDYPIESQTDTPLTDVDSWYYESIQLKFMAKWIPAMRTMDPRKFLRLQDWTLRYSRAPDATSIFCESNSGVNYDDVSPNSPVDTETTALTTWRGRYIERTYSVFDILFDWGDGHNTGWQSGEKFSHVYSRGNESPDHDRYWPFVAFRDQYGGISIDLLEGELTVATASGNTIIVETGDYSSYGQHKRLWAKSGAALDKFYHIESVGHSAGTTTWTLDEHLFPAEDGMITGDIIDVVDPLLGDSDGTYDPTSARAWKVAPTAIMRGRPIVAVSGSTIVLDGSESFTPNDDESLANYYFDNDDGGTSSGTATTYSFTYDTPGTYTPTLRVQDTADTGTAKESDSTSLTITILSGEDYGTPAFGDVYDLRANLYNQPDEIVKTHEREFQESEALSGGYPWMIDTRKKTQEFTMKGTAKPLKFYPGATTTQKDAGELDLATLLTLWKNGTIFKYKYRETRLSGTSDVKWFVGRIERFQFNEVGGQPHHYEWTATCHYVHGIAEASQEI